MPGAAIGPSQLASAQSEVPQSSGYRMSCGSPEDCGTGELDGQYMSATASVVNILDQKIAAPSPDHLSYTASRYALLGLTHALARGLAPRLRVNAVAPGHTLGSQDQTAEGFERAQSESPLGFGPEPNDISEAVDYLIGARAVTGQVLFVDSGERFLARSRDVLFETEDVV